MPLTDTHLVLLSAASQRDDGLLPRADRLAGNALHKLRSFLIKAELVEAVVVRADQPHWTKDEADALVGLRITAVGLTAIGAEQSPVGVGDEAMDLPDPSLTPEGPEEANGASDSHVMNMAPTNEAPRAGTKIARLRALLAQDDGVAIDAVVSALGWQPHTVRAAITRLRQSGTTVSTVKDDNGRTVYRSTAEPSLCEVQPLAAGEVA